MITANSQEMHRNSSLLLLVFLNKIVLTLTFTSATAFFSSLTKECQQGVLL